MSRLFILSLIAGVIGAFIASGKGRSALLWFFLCFLMPLSLIILSFLPKRVEMRRVRGCPHCGSGMKPDETVCPQCRRTIPVSITMVKCPSCGIMVRDGARCDNCGKPLP